MLDVFITSRVRRKIVVVYAKYPDFHTHVRGLAKLIKEDPGNIQRELKRLEKVGFLTSEKQGSKALADQLRTKLPPEVEILGPTPAFYERSRDTYRWQLILKSPKRAYLQTAISLLPPQHWQFELDPQSLL